MEKPKKNNKEVLNGFVSEGGKKYLALRAIEKG
jgi:hypothetical protein